VELAGERQIVTLTLHKFVGVSASSGKLLWEIPCEEIHGENCQTAVVYRDLLIFAGRKEPLRAIRLERTSAGIVARDAWKADKPTVYMSTPVLVGDDLYGLSDQKIGHMFCLQAASGNLLWQGPGRQGANAAILNLKSALLVQLTDGRLLVVTPNSKEYSPIAEYKVADSPTYAHPVFLGDRIVIKDAKFLRSFRIQ
jgi:outer membrane protein assembly factor BamB